MTRSEREALRIIVTLCRILKRDPRAEVFLHLQSLISQLRWEVQNVDRV